MKKEFRIKKHPEFDRIIKAGNKTKTEHFLIYIEPCEQPHYRVGLAIGKANGGAVQRVKQKRQVRAILAKHPPKSNLNYIIVIRPNFDSDQFEAMEKELVGALNTIEGFPN